MSNLVETKINNELGRYAVSNVDFKSGELIFSEHPFVVGPKPQTTPVCLGCCLPIDGSAKGPKCPKCEWPVCSENCPYLDLHANECDLFVKNNVKFHPCAFDSIAMQLDCITPLRLLLAKDNDPDRWTKEISLMEYHREARRNTDIWKADQINVVGYLQGPCKLKERFSDDLIQQACGILEINSFEGRTSNGNCIRCIYPRTAIMAHSCTPNTTHSILSSDNFKINVRAAVDIKSNEMIYTTYTYTLNGTIARQHHLNVGKFFTCHCRRCSDPTELGTYFSSLKCNKCDPGIISPIQTIDTNSDWLCSSCPFKTSGAAVAKAMTVIQSELDAIQSEEFDTSRLEESEKLFRKYRSVLHPNHYIQCSLRQNLIEMYGRIDGYTLAQLPDVMLEHKIDLCRHMLKVLSVLHPGMTRTRAIMLYELHAPIVLMARAAFTSGLIDGDILQLQIKEAIDILDECAVILSWEDVSSVERTIGTIAKSAANQLRESLSQNKF